MNDVVRRPVAKWAKILAAVIGVLFFYLIGGVAGLVALAALTAVILIDTIVGRHADQPE